MISNNQADELLELLDRARRLVKELRESDDADEKHGVGFYTRSIWRSGPNNTPMVAVYVRRQITNGTYFYADNGTLLGKSVSCSKLTGGDEWRVDVELVPEQFGDGLVGSWYELVTLYYTA
jgi:hypothetical protein